MKTLSEVIREQQQEEARNLATLRERIASLPSPCPRKVPRPLPTVIHSFANNPPNMRVKGFHKTDLEGFPLRRFEMTVEVLNGDQKGEHRVSTTFPITSQIMREEVVVGDIVTLTTLRFKKGGNSFLALTKVKGFCVPKN